MAQESTLARAALFNPERKSGKDKQRELVLQFQIDMKKMEEEIKKESAIIDMSKEEIIDQIRRTRNATKCFVSMLPEMDDADKKRLARASEPLPIVGGD